MQRSRFTLALTSSVLLAFGCTAGVGQTPGVEMTGPTPGTVWTPRFTLPAQKDPPNFLGLSGKSAGKLDPDQPYVVLETKDYPSFKGTQSWIKVAPISDSPNKPAKDTGNKAADDAGLWVYYGREGLSGGNLAPCVGLTCLRGKNGPGG